MAVVKFTSALKRFFPDLSTTEIEGQTILEVIQQLESTYPGLVNYLMDEQSLLRKHVNVFINGKMLQDRDHLNIPVNPDTELYFIQALSGG